MKHMGKIGHGAAVHIMSVSIRPSDGHTMYFTSCGADHATNRSMLRTRLMGELVLERVTCKKCLKREGVSK